MKIDPTGNLLNSFIDLNNLALARFSAEERARIGVHTCPGGDRDSTHSADVDYAELLPSLFELKAGNFYVALAGETDRRRVLKIIRQYLKPDQRVFVGVIAPIDPRVETPEEVRDSSPRSGRATSRSSSSAPPTTAGSRRSATTPRRAATPPSQRSARACSAPRWPPSSSESPDGGAGRRRGRAAPPLGRHAERPEHPAGAPAGRAGAAERQGSARAQDAGARPVAGPDGRDPASRPGTGSW